jgi:titin
VAGDTIDFKIPDAPGTVENIALNSALPPIAVSIAIDATTQFGWANKPLVHINGDRVADNGLKVVAARVSIAGLAIDNCSNAGILLSQGSGNDTISGCFIGTDASGVNTDFGNRIGVQVQSANNHVGDVLAGEGNLISGNGVGVDVTGQAATQNLIGGNYIGTDPTGNLPVPNGSNGILLENGANQTTVALNLISWNVSDGVVLSGLSTTHNLLTLNKIGTDPNVCAACPNGGNGVLLALGAGDNTLDHNDISGNQENGVLMDGDPTNLNTLTGNHIGTDGAGSFAIFNGLDGVDLANGASWNTIGGTQSGQGNLISGNKGAGVRIDSGTGTTFDNVVAGNFIGTNQSGTVAIPNSTGVVISGSDTNAGNTVGASVGAGGNLISGNTNAGVDISGTGSKQNQVYGNDIGTDASGTNGLGNGVNGVVLEQGASGNTIGGQQGTATLNVISGNGFQGSGIPQGHGVYISGRGTPAPGNVVEGNYIGVGVDGSTPLGNAADGVYIETRADSNTVGGTVAAAGNVISKNGKNGVEIDSSLNKVAANYIGTDATGTTALGNVRDGVFLDSPAANNTVGGTVATLGNVISGNTLNGVEIKGSLNVVGANYIGTDATGISPLGNGADGVLVGAGAANNTIGGIASAAGNVIAANGTGGRGYGLDILAGATGTSYDYNYIGFNVDGDATDPAGNPLRNKTDGVNDAGTGTVRGTHNKIQT